MKSTLNPPNDAAELSHFFTWLGTDGICRTVAKPNAEINIHSAYENTQIITSFYKSKKFPLLVDTRNMKSITREARTHFSTNGRDTKITCMALMVNSPVSRVIGNFFIGLNKPQVPARLFEIENDALHWLKQHIH